MWPFTIETAWQSSIADLLELQLGIAETTTMRAVRLRHLGADPKVTAFYLRGLNQAAVLRGRTETWIPTPR